MTAIDTTPSPWVRTANGDRRPALANPRRTRVTAPVAHPDQPLFGRGGSPRSLRTRDDRPLLHVRSLFTR